LSKEDCKSEEGRVILTSVLDLRAAAPLTEELLALRGNDLVIDASKVERIGAPCFQVLLSAVKTWAVAGHTIAIFDESPAFSESATHLGVCLSQHETNENETCL
jgi:chemotaxis protein CheX